MVWRLGQPSLPLIVLAALAIVAAGNTFHSLDADWRTLRSLILWAACVLILVARWRLGRQLTAAVCSTRETVWRFGKGMTVGIGALLLLLVIAGEYYTPEDGWILSHIRLIILTPVCILLLYDWHRVRRVLLAKATPLVGQTASARGAFALESLLFHGILVAACALAVLALGNALLSHHDAWLTLRPIVTCILLFATLWQMQYRLVDTALQLDASVQDDRAHTHRSSREWALDRDPARDRASSTDAILDALDLRAGMRVADVGTGGGYFATRMAEHVGRKGAVIATDVSPACVARLRERAQRSRQDQLQVHLVDPRQPLPTFQPVERVLLANVYLFSHGNEAQGRQWLGQFADALQPGGKLVVYNEFVHEAGWTESSEWPPLAASQPDAPTLIDWSRPRFDLLADVPLPAPSRLAPHERPGYLLVLKRRR